MSRRPTSARPRPKAAAALPRTLEVAIDSVGGRGDGIARHGGEQVFVPGTIPGEKVVVKVEGRRGDGLSASLLQVLTPAEGRQTPPCRHFGVCGGCALQHMSQELYQDWKRGQLVEAMGRAGFGEDLIAPLVAIPHGSRRRAAFAFAKRRKHLHLGFNARASHQLVDLEECLLLAPELLALLDPLRAVLLRLLDDGCEGDAVATLTETGIDLMVEAEARLDLFDRETLAAFAEAQDLARLSWRRPGTGIIEPLAHRRQTVIRFAGVGVELPPASFLQPSLEGERALAALVFDAVGAKGPVADLFSGCGSFTFPLAQKAQVHAVEGEEASLRALKAAADRSGARVTAEVRDLSRRPLLGDELKKFQAVVFDPPRAGAAAQAEHLAESGPALVVAVSCNPATLARDARILAKGGYTLKRATPVDQFPWSAHLEAVAVFERE
ncbi:MAG TPA: 23S rRNA (uracil(1939)-C(5))-methyltransferase RlmD [Candidatus Sulfotelmatobacter sp.]|jgi:23S rRNA (uracil1939-C5)-methyltransferase|nr:23S rRNA (uracil(1939)-C(5))-methyltransferase RlmD [Candidatus Sulfotelmatobacter sp.]